jgi:bacterioferritin-associated ferredoxin
MYICICNGITEEDVKTAVATGHKNNKEILKKLGVGDNCGVCLIDAIEKFTTEMSSMSKESKKDS